ncbi:MAG: hypothetical protein K6G94_10395 [Kiritimatiellae bacterium]|nr:hypothetical protein [Kiritimatiellia bacterium]
MMRMEIDFEQRGEALLATLRRDSPVDAAPMEQEAHDCVWNGLMKFCSARKITLLIPSPHNPPEPKPFLSSQPK